MLLALEAGWSGSRAALARRLGLSERTLYRRLREARAKEN
ncbi:helix-turn-helix domain-containing protein [Sutterella sp.]